MRAWRKVMAAYLRVYDSCHLLADCQKPNPTLGSRVWTTFNFFTGARSTSPTDIDRQLRVPCCRRSAANRRPLLSINGTDGRTDVWPLHETCCAYYICMHTSLYGSRIGSRILQGLVSNPSERGAGSQTCHHSWKRHLNKRAGVHWRIQGCMDTPWIRPWLVIWQNVHNHEPNHKHDSSKLNAGMVR